MTRPCMGIQTEPRHLRGQLYFWTNSGGSGLGVHPYNRDKRSGVRAETFPCCETRNTAEDSVKESNEGFVRTFMGMGETRHILYA